MDEERDKDVGANHKQLFSAGEFRDESKEIENNNPLDADEDIRDEHYSNDLQSPASSFLANPEVESIENVNVGTHTDEDGVAEPVTGRQELKPCTYAPHKNMNGHMLYSSGNCELRTYPYEERAVRVNPLARSISGVSQSTNIPLNNQVADDKTEDSLVTCNDLGGNHNTNASSSKSNQNVHNISARGQSSHDSKCDGANKREQSNQAQYPILKTKVNGVNNITCEFYDGVRVTEQVSMFYPNEATESTTSPVETIVNSSQNLDTRASHPNGSTETATMPAENTISNTQHSDRRTSHPNGSTATATMPAENTVSNTQHSDRRTSHPNESTATATMPAENTVSNTQHSGRRTSRPNGSTETTTQLSEFFTSNVQHLVEMFTYPTENTETANRHTRRSASTTHLCDTMASMGEEMHVRHRHVTGGENLENTQSSEFRKEPDSWENCENTGSSELKREADFWQNCENTGGSELKREAGSWQNCENTGISELKREADSWQNCENTGSSELKREAGSWQNCEKVGSSELRREVDSYENCENGESSELNIGIDSWESIESAKGSQVKREVDSWVDSSSDSDSEDYRQQNFQLVVSTESELDSTSSLDRLNKDKSRRIKNQRKKQRKKNNIKHRRNANGMKTSPSKRKSPRHSPVSIQKRIVSHYNAILRRIEAYRRQVGSEDLDDKQDIRKMFEDLKKTMTAYSLFPAYFDWDFVELSRKIRVLSRARAVRQSGSSTPLHTVNAQNNDGSCIGSLNHQCVTMTNNPHRKLANTAKLSLVSSTGEIPPHSSHDLMGAITETGSCCVQQNSLEHNQNNMADRHQNEMYIQSEGHEDTCEIGYGINNSTQRHEQSTVHLRLSGESPHSNIPRLNSVSSHHANTGRDITNNGYLDQPKLTSESTPQKSSKECPAYSKDNFTQSQDIPTQYQGNPTQSKDIPTQYQGNATQSQDNLTLSQDNPSQSQDNPTQSQDNATQSQDNLTQSQDNATQSQDNIIQSQDNATRLQKHSTQPNEDFSQSEDHSSQPKVKKRRPKISDRFKKYYKQSEPYRNSSQETSVSQSAECPTASTCEQFRNWIQETSVNQFAEGSTVTDNVLATADDTFLKIINPNSATIQDLELFTRYLLGSTTTRNDFFINWNAHVSNGNDNNVFQVGEISFHVQPTHRSGEATRTQDAHMDLPEAASPSSHSPPCNSHEPMSLSPSASSESTSNDGQLTSGYGSEFQHLRVSDLTAPRLSLTSLSREHQKLMSISSSTSSESTFSNAQKTDRPSFESQHVRVNNERVTELAMASLRLTSQLNDHREPIEYSPQISPAAPYESINNQTGNPSYIVHANELSVTSSPLTSPPHGHQEPRDYTSGASPAASSHIIFSDGQQINDSLSESPRDTEMSVSLSDAENTDMVNNSVQKFAF